MLLERVGVRPPEALRPAETFALQDSGQDRRFSLCAGAERFSAELSVSRHLGQTGGLGVPAVRGLQLDEELLHLVGDRLLLDLRGATESEVIRAMNLVEVYICCMD